MHNFLKYSVIGCLSFFSLSSIKAYTSDYLIEETKQEFLLTSIRESLREQPFTLLDLALEAVQSLSQEFSNAEKLLGSAPMTLRSIDIKALIIAMNYYPFGFSERELRELVKILKGKSVVLKIFASAKEFLEVNRLALTIAANSIAHAKSHDVDYAVLINETTRILSTSNTDFFGNRGSDAEKFFSKRIKIAQQILALLLTHVDLLGLKNTLISSEGSVAHTVFVEMSKKKNWYLLDAMRVIQSRLSEEEDVFELTELELKQLNSAEIRPLELSTIARNTLKETQLFKILDPTPRQAYANNWAQLASYHFFLGSIDEFLTRIHTAMTAQPAAIAVKEKSLSKNKKSGKKGRGKKNKAGHRQQSKPEKNLVDNETYSNAGQLETEASLPLMDKDIEDIIINADEDISENTTTFEEILPEISLTVDRAIEIPKRKVKSQARINNSHIHNTLPDFSAYVDKRQIEKTQELSYQLDNAFFDTNTLFQAMKTRVSSEASHEINLLMAETRGHSKSKAPNIATYFIRFHGIDSDGVTFAETFDVKTSFISGARVFHKKKERDFMKSHTYKTSFDMLKACTQDQYFLTDELRSLFLREALFNELNNHVIGPWFHNALDTEGLIFLDILKNTSQFLGRLPQNAKIQAVIIGIGTLYKSCYRCGNLMQGFQQALQTKLENLASVHGVVVPKTVRHMIIVDGELEPLQPVKVFMRSNFNVPQIFSTDRGTNTQFRLLIK